DRSLSEAARREKSRTKAWWSGPGRFGPSRKKEAAARRFGNYELWVFECCFGSGSADRRRDAVEPDGHLDFAGKAGYENVTGRASGPAKSLNSKALPRAAIDRSATVPFRYPALQTRLCSSVRAPGIGARRRMLS